MEQARIWSEAGERVCFVAYGRGVVEMARRALTDRPRRGSPAFIGTFHQLGYLWGTRPAEGADSDYWERIAPEQMLDAAVALPPEDRFTAFVVDEAQDFADSWWPALLASAASAQFRLAVFRDDEQSVFHERQGRPDLPLMSMDLHQNLRNARQIVDTFRPLVGTPIDSRSGDGFPVEFIECPADEVMERSDDAVASLVQERGWLPEDVALLTTKHRHPVHVERAMDKDEYWRDLWFTDDVFYSTVAGFKGLERSAIVLAVDGFHDGVAPARILYAGMSRARDLLIVVGPADALTAPLGPKTMRRLRRGAKQSG
jgi:superfamily I DNA/RNA helicase